MRNIFAAGFEYRGLSTLNKKTQQRMGVIPVD